MISIEHEDGSIARYMSPAHLRCLLKEGNRALAGQPLAVFINKNDEQKMLLFISHLTLSEDFKPKYIPLNTKYYQANGTTELLPNREYTAASTKEIIEKELTKREKKKLNIQ